MERQNPGKCGSGPKTLDSLPHQVNMQSREPRGNGEASRPGQLPARSSAHDHGGVRQVGLVSPALPLQRCLQRWHL